MIRLLKKAFSIKNGQNSSLHLLYNYFSFDNTRICIVGIQIGVYFLTGSSWFVFAVVVSVVVVVVVVVVSGGVVIVVVIGVVFVVVGVGVFIVVVAVVVVVVFFIE